jgi:outer membrane receptor protein involved in Fe transport
MRYASLGFRTIAACLLLTLSTVTATFAQAPASAVTGTVTTASGAPLSGAKITVSGPADASVLSSGNGSFSIAVPPGLYQIRVDRGGYQPVSLTDIAIAPGTTQPLTIALSESSLSSLRTIGTVTSTGAGRSTFNAGPAAQTFVPGDVFRATGNPEITDVLQRVPAITILHLGTQLDTSIVAGGLQPYETQVLIDGHPVALGQFGVWTSHYFPSFLTGGAEVEVGPGNTTPFANLAVGGTVNLTTPGYTTKPAASFTSGTDNYGSIYNNLIGSGKLGNLSYVVAAGQSWNNNPLGNKTECDVYQSDPSTSPNRPGFAGIVPFCGTLGGSLFTRGQLYKLKYDLSKSTSFEAEFIGTYGGYNPQDYFGGEYYGPTLVEACIPGTLQCTSPANQNLVGTTINGYFWYPGTLITNKQQIYSGQFRTSIGNDTLLLRPYAGNIEPETYDGTGEGTFPAFYAPNASYPACTSLAPTTTCYPGGQSLAPGVQIPSTGLTNPNAFESSTCPPGTITSFNQLNSPANTISTVNGQEECFQYPYSTSETNTLYGGTFTYIHPFGANYLNFTYDYHGQSTFAYADAPANFSVPPGSATHFSTFSLTGELHPARNLTATFGLYDTLWTASGDKPQVDANGNLTLVGLQRSVARFDPHLAFVFRPERDTAIRAAYGTSETFPFIGLVSGPAAIAPPNFPYTGGFVNQKNPDLLPETSIAYSLGADHRFKNGGVLSLDLIDTTVHNVFQQITTIESVFYNGSNAIRGIAAPFNVARLASKVATLSYAYAPKTGFGYNITATADSSILSGIPASAFNGNPGLPGNDVQLCGNGTGNPGSAACIPYLKGYGQLTYAWSNGGFAALGADYEGKNNTFYQPPFAVVDLTLREPVGKNFELQFSVQNLFNSNTGPNVPEPNAGVPIVGNTSNGTTIQQASFTPFLIPAAARTARLQLRIHVGGGK